MRRHADVVGRAIAANQGRAGDFLRSAWVAPPSDLTARTLSMSSLSTSAAMRHLAFFRVKLTLYAHLWYLLVCADERHREREESRAQTLSVHLSSGWKSRPGRRFKHHAQTGLIQKNSVIGSIKISENRAAQAFNRLLFLDRRDRRDRVQRRVPRMLTAPREKLWNGRLSITGVAT